MPRAGGDKSAETARNSKLTAHQVVISNATMISSFRINAVKEMATMFRNSFSNNRSDIIMMAPPRPGQVSQQRTNGVARLLSETYPGTR